MRLLSPLRIGLPLLTAVSSLHAQTTVVVGPTNPGSFSPIAGVTYDDNGTPVIQTSEPTTVTTRSTAVNLTGLTLANGSALDVFNFGGAQVSLGNFATAQPSGIGILQSDGSQVALNAGTAAFTSAAEAMLQSPNLNSYLYYDGISPDPAPMTADFSINFRFAFESSDYILVQERFGNTYFELTALDINGSPITGANVLQFGGPTTGGAPHTRYDWESGFANATYQSTQSYDFTVAEISQFFEGTGVAAVPIFGFSIDNDGEADVKFFGASDDTFLNNPFNPAIPGSAPVPEPHVALLSFFASLGLLLKRRR